MLFCDILLISISEMIRMIIITGVRSGIALTFFENFKLFVLNSLSSCLTHIFLVVNFGPKSIESREKEMDGRKEGRQPDK